MKESLKEKLKYFFERKSEIHIVTYGKRFYNGQITSFNDKFIEFEEFKLGTMVFYFGEIKDVEPFVQESLK